MAIPRFYPVTVGQEPSSPKARGNSGPRTPVVRDEAASASTANGATAPPGAGPAGSAEQAAVVLAPTLGAMAQAHGSGESAATERVATVREQIRAGTYKIDKDKLTARLVDEELARVVGGKPR